MVGNEDDATPTPRRRRRAVRRAAGPPGPHGPAARDPETHHPETHDTEKHDTEKHDTVSQDADSPDAHVQDLLPAEGVDPADVGEMAATAPSESLTAAPAHTHPHVPGPGHGGHPPVRESTPHPPAGTGLPQRRSGRSTREDAAERSLRSLVTTRSSQVSPVAAMRAREVALPSDADLAAAEAEVTIVRRHYVPPTALTAGRRPDRSRRRPGESGQ